MIKEESVQKTEDRIASGYIVGIGASAGGLEAINELFDNMPSDTGFAFVVVQHLSPDYKSLMGELLAKHTQMKILEVEDGMSLKANHIYLLPPKKLLTIERNKFVLREKVRDHHPNTSIDVFLESLAKSKKEKAVAIILSGTGTDGTRGIQAIKNNGGSVFVQDPLSAEFDGMPNSAIATGYADLILSPEMMPYEMLGFLQEAPLIRSFNVLNEKDEAIIHDILDLVMNITGHDFSHYKRPTLNRRLAKRMAEKNIKSLRDYYYFLSANAEEVKVLSREFLINVTKFFRDEEAFNTIKLHVLPSILLRREKGEQIKFWSVATSSGEEAYSLAMLCDEFIDQHNLHDLNVKIFATDIDQPALDTASKGIYNEESIKSIPPEKISKYFLREGNMYKVVPSLRKMVVFAKHDITKDPPFSQIDLLCCRNMLIYMNPALQKNILQKFHFALKDSGYLFLGPSENVGILKDVLEDVDKKWKIYKCISKIKTGDYETFVNPIEKTPYLSNGVNTRAKNALNHLPEIFKDTLLEEYSYAGIFIDKDFEVKQAIGNFKEFLNFPEGSLNFNLLKLVPSDLSIALSTTIRRAMKENQRVVQKRVKIGDGKNERLVNIIVKPYLQQKTYLQPFLFILLSEEKIETKPGKKSSVSPTKYSAARIAELEDELRDTKANLQAVIEEIESANEELQSSNEEIISANEELQSTNEELQSLNEELHTVNTEHQLKIKELIDLNDDLNNYFNNTDIGQVLIDSNLIIRKFTPVAKKQINFRETDIGRSITDISTNFKQLDFVQTIRNVIQTRQETQREVVMNDNQIYLMRVAPYIRQNQSMDGVVVTFINISQTKKLTSMLEAVLNSATSGILAKKSIRDQNGDIVDFEYIAVNHAAEQMLEVDEGALIGKRMLEEFSGMEAFYFQKYVEVVEKNKTMQFEFFNKESNRWYDVICVKMMDGLVTTFTNITEKKRAAELLRKNFEDLKETTNQLQASNQELERSNFDLLQFASVASHDLKEPLRKIQAYGNIFREKVKNKIDEKEYNYLNKVVNSAQRMQVLVDDILTLSKLSNIDTPHESVDLNKIIHRIVDDLEITIAESKADIQLNHLPTIYAVRGQMHQLFQNLIVNALKFCIDRKPCVKIYQEHVSQETIQQFNLSGEFICVVVEDNGIGFDEKYSEKIFGIFQRLNGANYQGTGIGLAICKKIVENHGGVIYAKSVPNDGSRFFVVLPKGDK